MKTNEEQRQEIVNKIEYYDNYFRKTYNLHRAKLEGHTVSGKYIKFSYKDNEAIINLKLAL